MGGCASKPKELEPEKGSAPVEQPPPATDEATNNTSAETQTATDEKDETEKALDGSNEKKDEGESKANLLPKASEPAPEPVKTSAEPVENKEIVAEEAKVEAIPAESKPEEAEVEAVPAEIKSEDANDEAVKEVNELPKEEKKDGDEIAQIGESVVDPKIEEKRIQQ